MRHLITQVHAQRILSIEVQFLTRQRPDKTRQDKAQRSRLPPPLTVWQASPGLNQPAIHIVTKADTAREGNWPCHSLQGQTTEDAEAMEGNLSVTNPTLPTNPTFLYNMPCHKPLGQDFRNDSNKDAEPQKEHRRRRADELETTTSAEERPSWAHVGLRPCGCKK